MLYKNPREHIVIRQQLERSVKATERIKNRTSYKTCLVAKHVPIEKPLPQTIWTPNGAGKFGIMVVSVQKRTITIRLNILLHGFEHPCVRKQVPCVEKHDVISLGATQSLVHRIVDSMIFRSDDLDFVAIRKQFNRAVVGQSVLHNEFIVIPRLRSHALHRAG